MRSLIVGMAALAFVGANGVVAGVITADVAVHSPAGQFAPLEVGQLVFSNWNRYTWLDVPTFAKDDDYLFWQVQATGFPAIPDGVIDFEVLTDGPVLMACTTRWNGGGSGGAWSAEVSSRAQIEAQGWVEVASGLSQKKENLPDPYISYLVFQRESVAGETFTYRTEKYCPPIIIDSVNKIPEPSTLVLLLSGALGIAGGWYRRRRCCR